MQSLLTQIQPLVKIRRNRSLPVSGTVLVRMGQKVTASDVLAESMIPVRHILVDVFKSLGLQNVVESEKMIKRKIGEQLDKHDIIAETGGLFSRVIRAPMPGKIISKKEGRVLLEVESRQMFVQSGFTGKVVEIIKDHGAVIETNGSLIQGVWGNGKNGFGPLITDTTGINQELTSSSLSITSRGTIVIAAYCEKGESLQFAASLPISGLILGSMNPRLVTLAQAQNYPIILLEGFGEIGINESARKLLLKNSQREASLNAVPWDHFSGLRPEISIAAIEEGDPEKSSSDFTEGQTVRIHSSLYSGQVGVISALIPGKSTLPNGVRTAAASILLQDNKEVIVPFSNFDIINTDTSSLG